MDAIVWTEEPGLQVGISQHPTHSGLKVIRFMMVENAGHKVVAEATVTSWRCKELSRALKDEE